MEACALLMSLTYVKQQMANDLETFVDHHKTFPVSYAGTQQISP